MGIIGSIFGGLLTGGASTIVSAGLGLAKAGIGYLDRRGDREVEKYKADATVVTELGGTALKVQAARAEGQKTIALKAMTHPIWWVAWIGFVLPPMLYDGMIYFVSTFDAWLNTPGCSIAPIGETLARGLTHCEWYVRRVPKAQGDARENIVYFIFGAQAVSGAAAGLGQAAIAWLNKRSAR